METIFESSLRQLKKKLQNTEINAKNIIQVVRFSMEIVESTTLKGVKQKELVEKLLIVFWPILMIKRNHLL